MKEYLQEVLNEVKFQKENPKTNKKYENESK
jgi:hypothetical protein